MFQLDNYLKFIEFEINKILSKKSLNITTYDIFDIDSEINKIKYLKKKQFQMKIGEIIQMILGNYKDFINLKTNHSSGLDIISIKRKIIIELKNRTNTDNASSRKTNLQKLAKFKKQNPDYLCIYGCLNENTKRKTDIGKIESLIIDGVEIKKYTGYKLLNLIFLEDKEIIINFVKKIISNNYQEI